MDIQTKNRLKKAIDENAEIQGVIFQMAKKLNLPEKEVYRRIYEDGI